MLFKREKKNVDTGNLLPLLLLLKSDENNNNYYDEDIQTLYIIFENLLCECMPKDKIMKMEMMKCATLCVFVCLKLISRFPLDLCLRR